MRLLDKLVRNTSQKEVFLLDCRPCAGSSVVEQEPFKLVVVGSIPTRRTRKTVDFVSAVFLLPPGVGENPPGSMAQVSE